MRLSDQIQTIRHAYPTLTITNIQRTHGQFSDVLLADDALVFRFPRSSHVAAQMAREIKVLTALQGKLPLPIPAPQYQHFIEDTLIFMGYPMLPGAPLLRDRFTAINDATIYTQLASELARFLQVLHTLPLNTHTLSAAIPDSRAQWHTLYAAFQDKLFAYMRPDARQQISAQFAVALNDDTLWDFTHCITHGDFGTGNLLYKDGHITGVIDFTSCGIGDPAQDCGALLASFGEDFIERVFVHYPALRDTLPRVRFIKSTYALQQAYYALRDGNQADFDDGMRDYV